MEAFQTVLQAYVVQDSPPYNRVLTMHARYTLSLVFKVSWLLFHNLLPSFDKTAAALAYTLVHLCVEGQIACHSRTKVSEVVDDPKYFVVDADRWRSRKILAHDVSFLDADLKLRKIRLWLI